MDNAEPSSSRAAVHRSCESLAASSPSNSMDLGTAAGQQGRGGGFVDPDDVDVNLEGEDSGWGEQNDILSYVQSKVHNKNKY